jgi:hypothetical protein
VLKLKRSLYGMRQRPKYFFEYLSTRLQKQGLRQSNFDPCHFIGSKVIVVTYVDDLLFYAHDDDVINQLIAALRDDDILICREGTAEGFLGVDVSRTWATDGRSPTITLTQKGLTIRVIEALGLFTSYTTKLTTPAKVADCPKIRPANLLLALSTMQVLLACYSICLATPARTSPTPSINVHATRLLPQLYTNRLSSALAVTSRVQLIEASS